MTPRRRLLLFAWICLEATLCATQLWTEPTYAFDWDAYMEQVYRFLPRDTTHTHPSTLDPPHGAELRYSKLYGDTGALVYPAAHVYIHSALLLATRWNPVLWTTEYTPKLIAGYERRIERPTGTIAAIQAAYLALYFVLLCELWAVLESAWKVTDPSSTVATTNSHLEKACTTVIPSLGSRFSRWIVEPLRQLDSIISSPLLIQLVTLLFMSCSRRVRATVILGLFNDAWAMLFAYGAVALAARHRWAASTLCFSLGVGVKMNILLFAPAFALLWLQAGGARALATNGCIAAAVQLAIGAPFLAAAPREYLSHAFNLGRAFDQQWSVNWRWLPPTVFANPLWSSSLLLAHLTVLAYCTCFVWLPQHAYRWEAELMSVCDWFWGLSRGRKRKSSVDASAARSLDNGTDDSLTHNGKGSTMNGVATANSVRNRLAFSPPRAHVSDASLQLHQPQSLSAPHEGTHVRRGTSSGTTTAAAPQRLDSAYIVFTLLSCNLIGVIFARSLHYQFELWYWHSLPILLLLFGAASLVRVAAVPVMIALELAWNVHPPTAVSSAIVTAAHACVLFLVLYSARHAAWSRQLSPLQQHATASVFKGPQGASAVALGTSNGPVESGTAASASQPVAFTF